MDAYIYMMFNGVRFFGTSPGDTGELERRCANPCASAKRNLCVCCCKKRVNKELGIYCSEKCRIKHHEKKGWKLII
jgi:hypothetical protein